MKKCKQEERLRQSGLTRLLQTLVVVICLCGFVSPAMAQITITGVVSESDGETMPGVNVLIKGTTKGVVTDVSGKYSISVPDAQTILVFSFIGYTNHEVTVADKRKIDVAMKENNLQLEEVVVIGYGTQTKRDITGSIASVSDKMIEQRQPVSVFDALQGAAPGVQISSSSGAPGAKSNITVRGASTFEAEGVVPLFIVDGVIVADIDNINPSDIKSMEILKDAASASIYGARSANGVIIITTKSGEAGVPRVEFRLLNSYSWMSNKLPQVNAFERILNNPSTRGAVLEKYSENADSVGLANSTNYYYQDLLTRTAVRLDANLSVSGGSDKTTYMVALGYVGDEGIIRTSYNNRFTGRMNVDYVPSNKLKFMTRFSFDHSNTNAIDETGAFQTAMRRPGNMIIYYPDGTFAPYYAMGGNRNPVQELYDRKRTNLRYHATLYQGAEYKFTDYLRLQANVMADVNLRRNKEFASKELASSATGKSIGKDKTTWGQVYQGEMFLNFAKDFGDHGLSAMLGTSIEQGTTEYLNYEGLNFVSESGVYTMNMIQELDLAKTLTSAEDYAMVGFFGRAGYNYKGRYIFNATLRYDGSSRFGPKERWGFFPSASIGWRFSDESFMQWAKGWLSDAKFRAGWGITGNDRVGHYESQTRYSAGNYYNEISGVATITTYGNDVLHWEETRQTSIGLDLNMFNGRISFVADYYVKNTKDLLADMNLPYSSGYEKMKVNLASLENRGVELSVTAYPIRNKDFSWQTYLSWWTNRNKITDLSRGDYVHDNLWLVAQGKAVGQWYGYRNTGIYEYDCSNAYAEDYNTRLTPVLARDEQNNVVIGLNGQPTLLHYLLPDGSVYGGAVTQLTAGGTIAGGGDVIWKNLPGEAGYDNKIDDNDREILGKGTPDWYGSWGNTLTYKNFSFSFNFYVSWGGLVYNNLKRYYTSWVGNTHMQHPDYIRTGWKYPGQITDWYALNTRSRKTANLNELSDAYLEDGSFIRLRNIRLSYQLDPAVVKKMRMQSLTFFVYGNNLFTWTNYSGFDPEVGGGVLSPGRDNSAYPQKRELGFGLNVSF